MKRFISVALGVGLASAAVVTMAALTAHHLRDLTVIQAETNLRNLTHTIAAQTDGFLTAAEAALRDTRDGIEKRPDRSPADLQAFVTTEGVGILFLRNIGVFDAKGLLRLLSNPRKMDRPLDASDQAWFVEARDHPARDMKIAAPMKSPFQGTPVIPLVFRLEAARGEFAGVVAGALDPAFFQALSNKLDLGAGATISLHRSEGTVLARAPQVGALEDYPPPNAAIIEALRAREDAVIRATGLNGERNLIGGGRVGAFPLFVTLSVAESAALRGWYVQATVVGVTTLALLVLIGWLGRSFLSLQREVDARARAEEALDEKVKALSVQEGLLRQAQEISNLGHYMYDIVADRWWSSDILDRIFGVSPDYPRDAEGWLGLVSPEMRIEMRQYLNALLAGDSGFEKEYWIIRPDDGHRRYVSGLGRIERDEGGRPLRMVGTIRDITEMKLADEAIRRSNSELEQFAYVASHDLREPLRMIVNFSGLIERRLGPALDDELREFFGYVKSGARRMDRLILDLLEFSRVGRIRAPEVKLPLMQALDDALDNLAAGIAESGATVNAPETLPTVWASPSEMASLFQNLIGNAIKYRSPERPCRIDITVEARPHAWAFTIADNGIGIDAEHADRIFRVFQRLHTQDAYGGGSGIGLAICKKIVERHGGDIWMESDGRDQGCRFVFTLPVASEHLPADGRP